jgi:hypothetical protein
VPKINFSDWTGHTTTHNTIFFLKAFKKTQTLSSTASNPAPHPWCATGTLSSATNTIGISEVAPENVI